MRITELCVVIGEEKADSRYTEPRNYAMDMNKNQVRVEPQDKNERKCKDDTATGLNLRKPL